MSVDKALNLQKMDTYLCRGLPPHTRALTGLEQARNDSTIKAATPRQNRICSSPRKRRPSIAPPDPTGAAGSPVVYAPVLAAGSGQIRTAIRVLLRRLLIHIAAQA